MKIITNNGFLQKTIIAVLIVLCFNFIIPTYSHADANNHGGVLFDPISDVLCSIGDAVVNLLQKCMTGEWGSGFSLTKGGFLVSDDEFTEWTSDSGEEIDVEEDFIKGWFGLSNRYYIPAATYSPEQIFAGKVAGLDINFINPNKYYDEDGNELYATTITGDVRTDSNGNPIPLSSAAQLQKTIASWYVALRNLSVVGLLSVLVYVGIRIIISSTASDKAKYKQLLMDWLIALCILFFMHYIMSFTLTMVESITGAIGNGDESVTISITSGDHAGQSFKTNLLGAARFKTQYKDFGQKVAYLIMYIALVIYTCVFTWFYLKRLLMMAFLTLIAPLVALTYPIDKISDGKAQAFNSWLKEYIFNALIQPFHLIIYMVFVGTAMDLATSNIIYMIAALGFILPAEKILRSFFGFNKAGATLGTLTGFTVGSIASKFLGGGKGGKAPAGSGKAPVGGTDKPPRYSKGADIGGIELPDDYQSSRPMPSQAGTGPMPSQASSSNSRNNSGNENQRSTQNRTLDWGSDNDMDLNENPFANRPYGDNDENPYANRSYDNENPQSNTAQNNKDDEHPYGNRPYSDEELEEMQDMKGIFEKQQDTEEQKPEDLENQNEQNNNSDENRSNSGSNSNDFEDDENAKPTQQGNRFTNGIRNLANYHNISAGSIARGIGRGAGRAIVGTAKFATRKTFRLAAGGLAAGVALATGTGMAGAAVAYGTFAKQGERLANGAIGLAGAAKGIPGAIRRERDIFNGGSSLQKAADIKASMRNEANMQYVKDMMTKEGWTDSNGVAHDKGYIPSNKDVKEKMKDYEEYFKEGLDIKTATKAQKVAKNLGISDEQSAKIASYGKENEIDKNVLNDEKKLAASMRNTKHKFMQKGHSEEMADKLTDHTFNTLKAMNGVEYTQHNYGQNRSNTPRQPQPAERKNTRRTRRDNNREKSFKEAFEEARRNQMNQ